MSKQIIKADISEFVSRCDKQFEKRLEKTALDILSNSDVRIVKLSGPTCSGKTTASVMLTKIFQRHGRRALTVSIDDFYIDTDILKCRSEQSGTDGIDYDSVDTIDLEELKRFVDEIFTSNEVHCPVFDFREGRRAGYKVFNISENDIVIFEGIQAVYPQVSKLFANHKSIGVFIMPMTNIVLNNKIFVPNEIRLMRRLVRDYNFRNTLPQFTFELWKSVRRNEESSIFPYAEACEYKIDSSMQYEIGILKPYIERILEPLKNNPVYSKTASEMIYKVSDIESISSEVIKEGSLYKEFV